LPLLRREQSGRNGENNETTVELDVQQEYTTTLCKIGVFKNFTSNARLKFRSGGSFLAVLAESLLRIVLFVLD